MFPSTSSLSSASLSNILSMIQHTPTTTSSSEQQQSTNASSVRSDYLYQQQLPQLTNQQPSQFPVHLQLQLQQFQQQSYQTQQFQKLVPDCSVASASSSHISSTTKKNEVSTYRTVRDFKEISDWLIDDIGNEMKRLTMDIKRKSIKNLNKQFQNSLMNYFLECHVSELLVADLQVVYKRDVFKALVTRMETAASKSGSSLKTRYIALLNEYVDAITECDRYDDYLLLLLAIITERRNPTVKTNTLQYLTHYRKKMTAILILEHALHPDRKTRFPDFYSLWTAVFQKPATAIPTNNVTSNSSNQSSLTQLPQINKNSNSLMASGSNYSYTSSPTTTALNMALGSTISSATPTSMHTFPSLNEARPSPFINEPMSSSTDLSNNINVVIDQCKKQLKVQMELSHFQSSDSLTLPLSPPVVQLTQNQPQQQQQQQKQTQLIQSPAFNSNNALSTNQMTLPTQSISQIQLIEQLKAQSMQMQQMMQQQQQMIQHQLMQVQSILPSSSTSLTPSYQSDMISTLPLNLQIQQLQSQQSQQQQQRILGQNFQSVLPQQMQINQLSSQLYY